MFSSPQAWPVPTRPRPIVLIGAGAIVRSAHLPAYRRLGLPVRGVFDVQRQAALDTARHFEIQVVFDSVEQACSSPDVVFDVAVPGDQVLSVLEALPHGAAVLVQKPMGNDLQAARRILETCRGRELTAALNFQLRFSPNVLVVHDLIERGALGEITDIEVRLQVRQPWENWEFARRAPRLEILYHSVHYLDAIRRLAGEPLSVYCRAVAHPGMSGFADTRSSIILDYGDRLRCSLALNHTHAFGPAHQASMLKVEGTAGAAMLTMGVNLDYPDGPPDSLEVTTGREWEGVPLRGSWFTEAFEGPMSNLQRFVAGEDDALISPMADAIRTMALVEACYVSSTSGGTPIPQP
ncbi:MAG: Gfo/Idh/MocA family oxidoreductase [Acidobacteria bacterium]|nr:Gfo/Idh/MocA family oxidoreductase [Acidobacteriota bacterium]